MRVNLSERDERHEDDADCVQCLWHYALVPLSCSPARVVQPLSAPGGIPCWCWRGRSAPRARGRPSSLHGDTRHKGLMPGVTGSGSGVPHDPSSAATMRLGTRNASCGQREYRRHRGCLPRAKTSQTKGDTTAEPSVQPGRHDTHHQRARP